MFSQTRRLVGLGIGALLGLAVHGCGGLCGSSSDYTSPTPPAPFPSGRLVNNFHAVGSVKPYPTVSQKELTIHRPTSTVTISYILDGKTVIEKYEMIAPSKK